MALSVTYQTRASFFWSKRYAQQKINPCYGFMQQWTRLPYIQKRLFIYLLLRVTWLVVLYGSEWVKPCKSWQDVSVNLSENILTGTETLTQESSIYLLGMSNHTSNFIFKTSQYPWVICCSSITDSLDMYILKWKEKHNFARLIFSFKKFL